MSRIVDAGPTAPEQVAQLRHAERDLSVASLVLLASQNGQHRVGQHSQCDVPIPALPVANFVVIQSAYELFQMREQRIGAILNNSSISGLVGIDGRAMYHAGKHGALGLTESAALDYAARVSASMRCAREVIDTPIVAGMPASQTEAMKELMKDVPIGRLGRPEEIAAAVLCLSRLTR